MCTTPVCTSFVPQVEPLLTCLAEIAFIAGVTLLGVFSIGGGFVGNKIALIVLRALSGLGESDSHIPPWNHNADDVYVFLAASLTIPSALTLLVDVFPEKKEQARTSLSFVLSRPLH
jgi:MFS family permease